MERGLSCVHLGREKCDLKGVKTQRSKLAQGNDNLESEARPTWISKKQTESPMVSPSPKRVQEFQEGKTDDLCTDIFTCGLWEGGQTARGSEHPSQGLPYACGSQFIKETAGILRGIPIRVGG